MIASKQEKVRPNMDIFSKDTTLAPSIKKALRERANFYRRKLTFYENLGVLAVSLTSEEMSYKIQEAQNDLKASVNTQNSMLANFGRNQYSNLQGNTLNQESNKSTHNPLKNTESNATDDTPRRSHAKRT